MSSSPSAGPSTTRRLTTAGPSSQVPSALSQNASDDDQKFPVHSGQSIFGGSFQPSYLDESDDLKYEADDDGAQSSPGGELGYMTGKEKARGEEEHDFKPGETLEEGENGGDYESTSDEGGVAEEERPNRYHGPSTTWMNWTKRERQEANAMDKIRARDLSLHLFNAFALKKRAERIARRRHGDTPTTTSVTDDPKREPDDENAFAPTKNWTGWPMPPSIVPRIDEDRFRDELDLWTMRMEPDGRPSAELEECLIAQMLQTAKERFNAREWDAAGGGQARSGRYTSAGPTSGGENNETVSDREQSGYESGGDGNFERGLYMTPFLKPTVLADDEKARSILRPAARNTLTKLDELLMGLHHARQAYVTAGGLSQPESEAGPTSPAAESSQRRKRRRLTSPGDASSEHEMDIDQERPQDLGSEPKPATPASDSARNPKSRKGTVKGRTGPGLPPDTQTRSQARRQENLGLRDWSDVLGVASMTGWAQPAVLRASHRCAELFGEDMVFRRMDEGRVKPTRTSGGQPAWAYTEDEDEGEQNQKERRKPRGPDQAIVPKYIGRLKEYSKYCPVTNCPRHTKGFSRTWNLNEHLKIKHPELLPRGRTEPKEEMDN